MLISIYLISHGLNTNNYVYYGSVSFIQICMYTKGLVSFIPPGYVGSIPMVIYHKSYEIIPHEL